MNKPTYITRQHGKGRNPELLLLLIPPKDKQYKILAYKPSQQHWKSYGDMDLRTVDLEIAFELDQHLEHMEKYNLKQFSYREEYPTTTITLTQITKQEANMILFST